MKKTNALIIMLAVFVALVAINFLASRHPFRIDLTQKRSYTLSDSTKKILKGLDDVMTIRIYFTSDFPPALKSLRRDVDDLLSEFKGASGSRIQIESIDPGTSIMEEQKAAMMGIPPVQLNVVERDKREVAKIYLGMSVLFGSKQQVLPVVKNLDNLEYELAEAILKVSSKELPKIGWWQPGHADVAEGDGFQYITEAISRRYDVTRIAKDDIADMKPDRFAAIVLAAPRHMDADELFALDQYLMGGGGVIALIDRVEIGPSLIATPVETNAADLIAGYGVGIDEAILVDQASAMAAFTGGIVTYHLPYPYWPEIRKDQFDRTDPMVAGLESAVMPWTSPLTFKPGDGGTGSPQALVKSSQFASTVLIRNARLDPQSAAEALKGGGHEAHPLIALMRGPLGSHYAAGKTQPPKGAAAIAFSSADARLLVTGSSRWITDRVLQTFPQNAALFQNALDSFAMGDLLIGIRSRADTSRPIAILSDGARVALKYSNMAAGPLLVVTSGAVLFFIRRAQRRRVQMIYGRA